MVIACSKCNTRFHVDDTRIPTEGVRVRCSRCKHSFFVRAPNATREEALHAAAAAAAAAPDSDAPEPSLDLAGTTAPPVEEEEDWQFAIEPPSAAADRALVEDDDGDDEPVGEPPPRPPKPSTLGDRAQELRASATLAEPETSSLADLANPESWDLLGGSDADEEEPEVEAEPEILSGPSFEGEPLVAETEDEPEPLDAQVEEPWEETPFADESPEELEEWEAPRARPRRAPRRTRDIPALAGTLRAAGWVALPLLLVAILHGAAPSTADETSLRAPVAVAGLEARDVEARFVENLVAGPLFVVTGSLVNPNGAPVTPDGAVRLVLLDERARPIPGAALAGLPLPAPRVREGDPDSLRAELEASAALLARRVIGAGEVVPFQIVLEGAGTRAASFRLEDAPAPPLPPPTPVVEKSVPSEPLGDASVEVETGDAASATGASPAS